MPYGDINILSRSLSEVDCSKEEAKLFEDVIRTIKEAMKSEELMNKLDSEVTEKINLMDKNI